MAPPSEAERLAQVGAKAACVDAAAAYVDVAGLRAQTGPRSPSQKVAGPDEGQVDSMRLFFFSVVKEDIIFKEISAIVRRWSVR